MSHKLNLDGQVLYDFYIKEGKSTQQIAKIFNCAKSTVIRHLRSNDISLRQPKLKVQISKRKLIDLYLRQKLSTYKIAKRYNCKAPTILTLLKEHKIDERPLKPKEIKVTKSQLEKLYVQKNLSMSEIASKFCCSRIAVFKKMKRYGINSRTLSEACTHYPKRDFSGDLEEKAYLIGFRTGDLRVRRNCKLIDAGCGTTKREQLELIEQLFFTYGPIRISYSKKYGNWHIDCRLNESFNFLLPKLKNIPNWILDADMLFWAFVAGYIDAEGSIGVYQNRARLRVGSYDTKILAQIHKKLRGFGMRSTFNLERSKRKGQNQDFWRVSISEQRSLITLLNTLEKRLKHKKRLNDLEAARTNLLMRINDKV